MTGSEYQPPPQTTSFLRGHGTTIAIALVGWILAGAVSYSAMTSRVTAVEVTSASHERRIQLLEDNYAATNRLLARLEALLERFEEKRQ